MTDEELALRLTEALDARIAAAADRENPHPVASEQTEANASPTQLRAVPLRKLRLRRAVAALLALCLLGAAGLLLARQPWRDAPIHADPPEPERPVPQNCHPETFPDGESALVMDRAYDGEYHLEKLFFPSLENANSLWAESAIPEGFLRQTLMSYEDYAAYCASFSLEQAYSDPEARYLVVAYARDHAATAEVIPVDLAVREDRVWLWLWDEADSWVANTAAYVLTLPVPAEAEALELISVLNAREAEVQRRFHSTRITEQDDGKYRIEGWTAGQTFGSLKGAQGLLLYLGKERIGLIPAEDARILPEAMGSEDSYSHYLDYASGLQIRAEDCEALELPATEWVDRWYSTKTLTILSTKQAEVLTSAKPVIYLYPEQRTRVSVRLDLDGELSCTYPACREEGWTVTAEPDGTLTDEQGRRYNYLYWEGSNHGGFDFSRGFCVRGQDTAAFLEEALEKLGLTRREANEFIVYWLPLMQDKPWNLIAFQGAAYTDQARLTVEPAPDTLIRVFMAWKPLEAPVEIEPQDLSAPERVGFTVVEWGGSQLEP